MKSCPHHYNAGILLNIMHKFDAMDFSQAKSLKMKVILGNYTVNLPSWFPTAEGCQVVFPAKHTKHAKKVCITPVACGRKVRMSVLSMPVKPPDAQRTAECPGRDGQKIIFRAVDGGAPARAKHGGFTGPIKFLSCLSCVSREMVLGKSTV